MLNMDPDPSGEFPRGISARPNSRLRNSSRDCLSFFCTDQLVIHFVFMIRFLYLGLNLPVKMLCQRCQSTSYVGF